MTVLMKKPQRCHLYLCFAFWEGGEERWGGGFGMQISHHGNDHMCGYLYAFNYAGPVAIFNRRWRSSFAYLEWMVLIVCVIGWWWAHLHVWISRGNGRRRDAIVIWNFEWEWGHLHNCGWVVGVEERTRALLGGHLMLLVDFNGPKEAREQEEHCLFIFKWYANEEEVLTDPSSAAHHSITWQYLTLLILSRSWRILVGFQLHFSGPQLLLATPDCSWFLLVTPSNP